MVTFWNFLAVKFTLENYSNKIGFLSPIRQPGAKKTDSLVPIINESLII